MFEPMVRCMGGAGLWFVGMVAAGLWFVGLLFAGQSLGRGAFGGGAGRAF